VLKLFDFIRFIATNKTDFYRITKLCDVTNSDLLMKFILTVSASIVLMLMCYSFGMNQIVEFNSIYTAT